MFLRLCPGNNSNGGFAIALGLNNQTVAHVNGTVGLRSKSLVVSNNNESLSVTFAKFEKQLVKFLLVPCVETARRLIGKKQYRDCLQEHAPPPLSVALRPKAQAACGFCGRKAPRIRATLPPAQWLLCVLFWLCMQG